jgi:hypothetical protein
MALSLRERLTAYKYHKAFGKFTDDLFHLFGTQRKKPHYVALNIGGQQMWMQPIDAQHRQEMQLVETMYMGHSMQFPGTPCVPKIVARFRARGDMRFEKVLQCREAYRTPIKICGHPFFLSTYSLEDAMEGDAIFEFEHSQDSYQYSTHIQYREKSRRIQKNFEPQTLFGSPQFEAAMLKWRDVNNWSPRNRQRPQRCKVDPYMCDYDYDYSEDEFA